ncbi:Asp/Glu/hydantoin racemase [Virgibacillus halotolerans]|uniref:aspartate/glutamate racemase family protein n=1 Tax=Virgibacillus halotolerans TaxID=1071053 RepID=UPI0019607FE2|nr:aspartate/glutamate racemase family protein [Virgibacillus halotolerans]MBM7599117.1 Asp/Glu/hydantoin racemase [Virgibacillus halotolerans]
MLGIIRVLTTEDNDVLNEHSLLMKTHLNIASETRCIPGQWNGIYDEKTESIAESKIIKLAKEMESQRKYTALTISCAADPALNLVRKNIQLPVFGAGESGAYAASMVGNNVGIIGITEEAPLSITRILGEKYHSYAYEHSLRKTTDLFAEDAKEKLLTTIKGMVSGGADVILFACTGFSTISLKHYLNKYINIPVIDLVEAQAIAFKLINKEV